MRSTIRFSLGDNVKHLSHWHMTALQLFCELSCETVVRHSWDCLKNFYVSQTSHQWFRKEIFSFNQVKILCDKIFTNPSQMEKTVKMSFIKGKNFAENGPLL